MKDRRSSPATWILLAGVAFGCEPIEAPTVQIGGCRAVRDGACLPSGDSVVLWVGAASPEGLGASVDGVDVEVEFEAIDGGQRARVEVAGAIEVAIAGSGWRWVMPLGVGATELKALWDEGGAACTEGQTIEENPVDPFYLSGLARCLNYFGEWERAVDVLTRSTQAFAQLGDSVSESRDAAMKHQVLRSAGAPWSERRDALPPLRESKFIEREYYPTFERGLLEADFGDTRASLALFESASSLSARLDKEGWRVMAEKEAALTLQRSGRHQSAVDRVLGIVLSPDTPDSCERLYGLENYAWTLQLAQEAGQALDLSAGPDWLSDEPRAVLEEIIALYEGGCSDPQQGLQNARLGLALDALFRETPHDAQVHLDIVRDSTEPLQAEFDQWKQLIEAQTKLASGQSEQALGSYRALQLRAGGRPHLRWRSLIGEAATLEALGETEAALEAHARARALYLDMSRLVPLHLARGDFLADLERAVRSHAGLLLRLERPLEAMDVLRSFRHLHLVGLQQPARISQLSREERADWEAVRAEYRELTAARDELVASAWSIPISEAGAHSAAIERLDEEARALLDGGLSSTHEDGPLRAPNEGELMLLFAELNGSWWAFGRDAAGLDVRDLGPIPFDGATQPELSDALLDPISDWLESAQEITFFPMGALRSVPLHALPYPQTAPLLAWRPVSISLDLDATSRPLESVSSALIVADPRGDLAGARAEGRAVAAALSKTSAEVRSPKDATRARVLKELQSADWFHYAGHGVFGAGGWDASLLLADETELSAGDILSMERTPGVVILSACESSRSTTAAIERLGLGQAFAVAGSQEVIAVATPVDDDLAHRFVEALYEARTELTPAAAFQRAALEARSTAPDSEWASFQRFIR